VSIRAYASHMWNLRGATRRCFLSPDGKPTNDGAVLLTELRRFCHGNRPTIKAGPNGVDVHASVAAAARQEVYFRITSMLNLDHSDLHALEKRAQMEDEAHG
jgi:hypothetical protein